MAEIRLSEELDISAGQTKKVHVYSNIPGAGMILSTDFLNDESIIILEQYADTRTSGILTLHKLITTRAINRYPLAVYNETLLSESTKIPAGVAIAITLL